MANIVTFSFLPKKILSITAGLLRLSIPRETFIRLCFISWPLLITLMAVKQYKIVFALWPVTHTLDWVPPTLKEGLFDHKNIRLFVFICIFHFLCWKFDRKHVIAAALSLFALLGLSFLYVVFLKNGSPSEFLTVIAKKFIMYSAEIYLFRTDIAFAIVLSLFVLMLLKLTPRCWQTLAFRLLLCLNAMMLAMVGLELAHYLETGITVSGGHLAYFFRNVFNVQFWLLILSVSNSKTFVPVGVTLLLGGLGFLVIRFVVGQLSKDSQNPEKQTIEAGRVIWPLLALIVFVPNAEGHRYERYQRFNNNMFMTLGQYALVKPLLEASQGRDAMAGKVENYDTSHLTLKATSRTRPLNVVIIMLESIRAQSTSLYNTRLNNTPFLSALSQRSLVVESMHTVVPRTSAAWVSVLQGIYPSTDDVIANWANNEAKLRTATSLPRLLKGVGYRSAFFVPTHLEYENEERVILNMDFDRVVSKRDYDSAGFDGSFYFGLEDRVMLRPILSWVDDQKKDNVNFLLTIMTHVGHNPYKLPAAWKKQDFAMGEDDKLNNYLNCVAYIDDFLKQLFDGFAKRGLLDSTIFFILGDHGEAFYEHGVNERAVCPYEEALHVPMLVFAPGLHPNGGRISGFRQQIDIIPTVADMLGYAFAGGNLPGLSLLAKLPADRKLYFSSFMDQVNLGMLQGTKKYIYLFDRSPMEVYDLALDPNEVHNIAKSLSKDQIKSAKTDMLSWYEQVKFSQSASPIPKLK